MKRMHEENFFSVKDALISLGFMLQKDLQKKLNKDLINLTI